MIKRKVNLSTMFIVLAWWFVWDVAIARSGLLGLISDRTPEKFLEDGLTADAHVLLFCLTMLFFSHNAEEKR